ncbi:gamma-glutamyltransferase [Azospirillum soli]|uniref:gamma-glutamyltransferase n=1 Tax=Azospirillum soli TaxID=1304799 RepID=UPI001AEA8BAA|nr:gamma-glutamyltransferase [Azospirillum soli]MBP2311142.1 gamma-glutamyltranspeptidase/glutathione hydrolase [Azospirillum soli]
MGAIAIAAMLLPGCVNTKYKTNALLQSYVMADEPRAAGIGRDIIAQGGRAGDAAAAMALAMTATLPSRVGLNGGGVCVVFNAAKKEARTLDFLPRPAATSAGPAGVATPAFLRGVYALQASAGVLRWEQTVVPAEQLARSTPVSRALGQDLATFGARLATDPEAKRVFLPTGAPLAEGTPFSQPDLANTLSQVRRTGVASLYGGPLGATVAQSIGLDPSALRGYQPRWGATSALPLGIVSMHFAQLPEPESGAALTAAWNAAADLAPAQRAARVAQALGATGNGTSVPGAGLVVIDPDENGVACTFTMGAPFGTGRMVPGTGLLAARGVDRAGFGTPALLANGIVGRTLFAGTGTSGGNDGPAAGPLALLTAALPAALERQPAGAIQAARPGDAPGRASFTACQVSMESGWKECQMAVDPRTHGLGIQVETPRETD